MATVDIDLSDIFEELIGSALKKACGMTETLDTSSLGNLDIAVEQHSANDLLANVWSGSSGLVWLHRDGVFQSAAPQSPRGLLCGAFHPLHSGHTALRDAAEKHLGGPVFYELSIRNADKPPLDYLSILQRCRQFSVDPSAHLALTNAPTFHEKSQLLPATTFVIGVDTAERILQPRFYDGQPDRMHQALNAIRSEGCRFLVAGRRIGARFVHCDDLEIPVRHADLFTGLSSDEFRADVSSTQHRRNRDP